MPEPLISNVGLNLEQLRLVSKSVSKTMDAEMRKLKRLDRGTSHYIEVSNDYATLDEIDAVFRDAIRDIVARGLS